jgi:segregation and condensation protein B
MTASEPRALEHALEVILFAAAEPISSYQVAQLLNEKGLEEQEGPFTPGRVEKSIEQLVLDWADQGRPLTVLRIAGGYQMATRPEWADLVARLMEDRRSQRLSRAALETLAIIAYRQPVIRPDIDAIRGVNSDSAIKTLLERDLVTIAGRHEGPGRPLLYRTTPSFLKYFGLHSLADLPEPTELAALLGPLALEASPAEVSPPEEGEGTPAPPAGEPDGEAPAETDFTGAIPEPETAGFPEPETAGFPEPATAGFPEPEELAELEEEGDAAEEPRARPEEEGPPAGEVPGTGEA